MSTIGQGRPPEAAHGTRERIRSVALELFSSRGYSGTSIRDIAGVAGVAKASVSHYFPKDELLRDLLCPLLDDTDLLLDHATAQKWDPRGVVEGYVGLLLAHNGVVVLLARDLSSFNHPSLKDRVEDQNGRFMDLLAGPRPSGAARLRAAGALGCLLGCLVVDPGGARPEVVRDTAVSAALGALG